MTKEISNVVVVSDENWIDGSSIINAHLDLINDTFTDPSDLGRKLGLFTLDKHLVNCRPWAINRVKAQFITHPSGSPGIVLTFELSPIAKLIFFISRIPVVSGMVLKFFLVSLPRDILCLLRRRRTNE